MWNFLFRSSCLYFVTGVRDFSNWCSGGGRSAQDGPRSAALPQLCKHLQQQPQQQQQALQAAAPLHRPPGPPFFVFSTKPSTATTSTTTLKMKENQIYTWKITWLDFSYFKILILIEKLILLIDEAKKHLNINCALERLTPLHWKHWTLQPGVELYAVGPSCNDYAWLTHILRVISAALHNAQQQPTASPACQPPPATGWPNSFSNIKQNKYRFQSFCH